MSKEKMIKNNKGITLIALVITIIVLIILAGVSINLVFDEDGIIEKAKQAAENMEIAANEEEKQLSDLLDEMNSIGGIDWEYAKSIAVAPDTQDEERNNGVIGLGTNGKPVDMDLWEYTKLEDGTYALNDEESLTEEGTKTSGYNDVNLDDGKIQGTVPQYIKTNNDDEFVPVTNINYLFLKSEISEAPVIPTTVTSMRGTFNTCENLTKMPIIPSNVTNMYGTFAACSNLVEITEIPNKVENMYGTFLQCSSLTKVPTIPNSVIDMSYTFYKCISLTNEPTISSNVRSMRSTFDGCTQLVTIPRIPNTVVDMYGTFRDCTSLKTVPAIPDSVKVLCATFKNCSNLQGTLEINASVNGTELGEEYHNNIDYNNCLVGATTNDNISLKVIGNCVVLDKIVEEVNNPNITL